MTNLVARLAEARLAGGTVTFNEAESLGDSDFDYRMQGEILTWLGPVSDAWKVGSTSVEAQTKLGTSEPGAARVPERYRHDTGDTIPVHATHDLWVEAEFALRLGRDLPPRAARYEYDDVARAIDGVASALEVVGSRLAGGLATAGRHRVTVDGGANVALVIGPVVREWRDFHLPSHPVVLLRNGIEIASGTGARALGDPVAVVVWLANHQRQYDGLQAGEIVSTGTCTGLERVTPGDLLTGDFGAIGMVEGRLADAAVSRLD